MSTHLIVDEKELQEAEASREASNALEKEITDNLPDKLRGKSIDEVAEMYVNLEKRFGAQGNELGELRKLTDQILRDQTSQKPESNPQEISDEEFFTDPKSAVSKVVEQIVSKNPKLNKLDEMERSLAVHQMRNRHPDMDEILQNDGFSDWVSKSKLRISLFNRGNNFDVEAASDLFDLWKEHQNVIKTVAAEEKKFVEQKRKKDLQSAASESGASDATSKTVFRRSDLIRMRIEDPQKYSAMQDEIMLAYQEGRVR